MRRGVEQAALEPSSAILRKTYIHRNRRSANGRPKANSRFRPKKEDYENIIIKSDVGGQMLSLKDIASIEFGKVYYNLYSKLNGKPTAAIVIKQSYGSNANDVIKQ